jgi:hypothetical protein
MASVLRGRQLWAAVAIVSMWMTVLFVGLYGPEIVDEGLGGGRTEVPSSVAIGLFALIGTVIFAIFAFRGDGVDSETLGALIEEERVRQLELRHELDELKQEVAELSRRPGGGATAVTTEAP